MLGRREAPTNGWSERSEQEASEASQSSLETVSQSVIQEEYSVRQEYYMLDKSFFCLTLHSSTLCLKISWREIGHAAMQELSFVDKNIICLTRVLYVRQVIHRSP